MPDLSIIFPIHNEEKTLQELIHTVDNLLKAKKISSELIFVENGSTDNSLNLLSKVKKKYENINILISQKGWGNAVKAGIKSAKGKYTCYIVSDLQINPKYIFICYDNILKKNLAMVKVHRTSRENTFRFINSLLYNFFVRIIFDVKSLDINGTPKVLKTSLLRELELKSENIAIDLELLLKLKKRNLSWFEIPVQSAKRSGGMSSTNITSACEMIFSMIKFIFKDEKNW